jgi:hypothetical protein
MDASGLGRISFTSILLTRRRRAKLFQSARWWRSPAINPRGIPIYPGIALERLGSGFNWPPGEIGRQIELEQSIGPRSSGGFILWNINQLARNEKGIAGIVATIR